MEQTSQDQIQKLEKQVMLTADRRRLKKNDPRKNLLTIKQAIQKYYPQLFSWVERQKKKGKIKFDGALDSVQDGTSYILRNLDKIYINVDAQRVLGLKKTWIRETLEEYKGFLHEKCNLSLFYYEEFDIYAVADGMHRVILAYICNVSQVQTVTSGTHKIGSKVQECIDKEYEFLVSRNFETNELTAADRQLIEKKAKKLSKDAKAADSLFKGLNINCGSIGADDDFDECNNVVPPDFSYPSEKIDNLTEAFNNKKSIFYVGIGAWRRYAPLALDTWDTRYTQKDIALVKVMTILDKKYKELFKEYLSSDHFEEIDINYWTAKCVHGEAIITAVVRFLCDFNDYYREENGESLLCLDDLKLITEHKKLKSLKELKHTLVSSIMDKRQLDLNFADYYDNTN